MRRGESGERAEACACGGGRDGLSRANGQRIRYLRKKAENDGGCGHWFRYSVKMGPIRVVWQQIAERKSDRSAKWR